MAVSLPECQATQDTVGISLTGSFSMPARSASGLLLGQHADHAMLANVNRYLSLSNSALPSHYWLKLRSK